MKNKSLYILFACMLAASPLFAQQAYLDQIAIDRAEVKKEKGEVLISIDINLDELNIDKNHFLELTPAVVSLDGRHQADLKPLQILGGRRNTILSRPFTWDGKTELNPNAFATLVRKNGTPQKVEYGATLPFEKWQRNAKLILRARVVGCADCLKSAGETTLLERALGEEFTPDFRMAYIVPEMEAVKQRSESYSAYFNYVVGRHDLLPNFENNAAELTKVDKSIQELKSDKDLTIKNLTVSGYASPEDTEQRNLLLSQRRAETFAAYLEKKYGFARKQLAVEWFGEDWKGLREAVAASSLAQREAVLRVIDATPGQDARDAQLVAIDNGATYRQLLNELYPPLRRSDYNISFISRPFNVDEAKEIIKVNPNKLSLNEMYWIANTYPVDSPEFRQVFDVAAKTFPQSEVANLNRAINLMGENKIDEAVACLQKLPQSAKALGLLGVAYIKKGVYDKAESALAQAAAKGDADAAHNLKQLRLWLETM